MTNPMAVFLQSLGESAQTAQMLRSAAQQQQHFDREMQLRDREQKLRESEFQNTQQQQGYQRQRQGQGDLMSALEAGGQPVSPEGNVHTDTDVPRFRMDDSGAMTPAGSGVNLQADLSRAVNVGGRQVYMPTPQETATREQRQKVGLQSALNDANDMQVPDQMADAAGMAHGSKIPRSSYDTMLGRMFASQEATKRAEDKPATEPKLTPHFTTDDSGKVSAFSFDPTTGEVKQRGQFAGAGPHRKDPDAPKQKQATPAQLNAIDARKRMALTRAEVTYKKAMKDAEVGGYTDTDRAAQALDELHKAKQGSQDAYETELAQFGVPIQHVEYPEEKQAAPAAQPAQPAQPAQGGGRGAPQQQNTKGRGKLTDISIAKHYLEQAGGDKTKARKLAKADGWEF